MTVTRPLHKTQEEKLTIHDMPFTTSDGTLVPRLQVTSTKIIADMSNMELLYVRALLASDLATCNPKHKNTHVASELINRINAVLNLRANGGM